LETTLNGKEKKTMKKLLLTVLVFLAFCSFAWGDSFEQITVGATVVGLTKATVGLASWGLCQIEGPGPYIRYRMDSGTPTTTVGVQGYQGSWIVLDNRDQLRNFRAIRSGGADVTINCSYFQQ
jgi:hypothetical protein